MQFASGVFIFSQKCMEQHVRSIVNISPKCDWVNFEAE